MELGKAKVLQVFVGSPEDDTLVTVASDQTISEILAANKVSLTGTIQLNGRALNSAQLNKTLLELGISNDGTDSIHVVRKMDGAGTRG